MGALPLKQMKILVGSLDNHEEEVYAAAATFSAAAALFSASAYPPLIAISR